MRRARALHVALLLAVLSLGPGGCSVLIPRENAGIGALEALPGAAGESATCAKYAGWIIGAPLTLALLPVGALAWATPWVDLPLGVDIVTAPSIALGYALEVAVGGPLWSLYAPFADEPPVAETAQAPPALDARAPPWATRAWVPPGFLCEYAPRAAAPRPPAPLPPSVTARYAVPETLVRSLGARVDAALRERAASEEGEESDEPIEVPIDAAGPAALEIYLCADAGPGPRPLLLLTPPSEANFAARWLARRYARLGVHAAVVVRGEEAFLDPALDAAAIERKLRETVVAARAVVAVLRERPFVARERVLYLGISAGGIFGAVLLALEPGIERAVLIYPGGDMPALVATSAEPSVRAYRESWEERGVPPDALAQAFARSVETDPIRLARHIDARRVLLFLSASDTSVPIEGGRALGRAMGSPETYVLAGDHESSGICFGFILRLADAFLLDR